MSSPDNREPRTIGPSLRGVALVCLLMWVVSGIYVVKADEAGVVRQFGRVLPIPEKPGIHYHLPYPISAVTRPKVTQVKSLAIGFDPTQDETTFTSPIANEQAEFLTGDDNIIQCKLIVQWSISDPIAYTVASQTPETLLLSLAESSMMEELGGTTVDDALTSKKVAILNNLKGRVSTELDRLNVGIGLVALDLKELAPPATANVAHAFKDVASAREDAARMIHESEGYRNEAFPKARGEAVKLRADADAYKNRVVNLATGDAERFSLLRAEYQKSPSVTRRRLFLETMDEVMPRLKKYLLGTPAGERATKVTLFMDEIKPE